MSCCFILPDKLRGRRKREGLAPLDLCHVVIRPPHRDRVETQIMRDVVHHPFDPQHPLRTAKAAKGGGALGVGPEPVAFDADMGQVIGIVCVQHGAIGHQDRKILRPAASRILLEFDTCDHAAVVTTNPIGDPEIMPLAGDHEIIIPVISHLGRLACGGRNHGAGDGQCVALAFLAPETAAHAAGFHPNAMHRQVQRVGDLVLDLGRVLGRGMYNNVAAFLRQGHGGLAFEVEMLLPTHLDHAGNLVWRGVDGLSCIAFFPDARPVFEPGICGQRFVDGQDRITFAVADPAQTRRLAGGKMAGGGNQKDRLAKVLDRRARQQRFVMGRGGTVTLAWQVFRFPDGDNAGCGTHGVKINRRDPSGGDAAQTKGQMQRAPRGRDVIDIARLSGDMQARGIMGQGFRRCSCANLRFDAHADTSSTFDANPLILDANSARACFPPRAACSPQRRACPKAV